MSLVIRDLYFNRLCSSILLPNRLRPILYKLGGIKIGKGTIICGECFCGSNNLVIGENTFINYDVWFNTAGGIEIGNNCNVAYKVTFITSTHKVGTTERRAGDPTVEKIVVGNGCWIGGNACILPGVIVGNGVIIAAGSVVISDCEANCVYAGNPAKKVKSLI